MEVGQERSKFLEIFLNILDSECSESGLFSIIVIFFFLNFSVGKSDSERVICVVEPGRF